ncbi:MAG: ABC transporter permease [Bacteroidota bacterium]
MTKLFVCFRELWNRRELLFSLTKRDIKSRYQQTFFGMGWSLFQPVMQAVVYTVAFSLILKVPIREGIPYMNFVFCNLTLWTYFASTTLSAMNSIRMNSALITRVAFPREIIPFSTILSGLFDFIIMFIVLVILNAFVGFYPNIRFLYLPTIILIEILFILNISLVLSVISIVRRDITHVVNYFIMLYMFISPVFFPFSALPAEIQRYYFLNPMGTLLEGFKNIIFLDKEPRWFALMMVIIILIVLFFPCYIFFKKAERSFTDVL